MSRFDEIKRRVASDSGTRMNPTLVADREYLCSLVEDLVFVAQETVLRLERDCEYDDIRNLLEIARNAIARFVDVHDAGCVSGES